MRNLFTILLLNLLIIPAYSQDKQALAKSDELFAKGVELYRIGKYTEAIPLFTASDKIDKTELDSASTRRNYSSMWLSSCYYKLGKKKKAKDWHKSYNENPIDRRLTVVSDSLFAEGNQHYSSNQFNKAYLCFEKCATLEREILGTTNLSLDNVTIQRISYLILVFPVNCLYFRK